MDLSHPVWLFIHVISAILSLKVAQTVATSRCILAKLSAHSLISTWITDVIQEIPLKSEVISLLVDKHNYLRRGIEDAANMRKLVSKAHIHSCTSSKH